MFNLICDGHWKEAVSARFMLLNGKVESFC